MMTALEASIGNWAAAVLGAIFVVFGAFLICRPTAWTRWYQGERGFVRAVMGLRGCGVAFLIGGAAFVVVAGRRLFNNL